MMQSATGGKIPARPPAIGGLLFLSLLWTCGPLRSELLPEQFVSLPAPFAAQALPLALLAATAAAVAWRNQSRWPRGRLLRSAVWIGLGLFTAPAVLIHLSSASVSGIAQTALLTLVLVFSIVFEPYIGHPGACPIRSALPAAFVAVLGVLLVFPVTLPASMRAAAAFLAVLLAAGCIAASTCHAVAIFRDCERHSAQTTVAVAAVAAAVSLGVASLLLEHPSWQPAAFAPELLWASAIELPQLLLLFWLMQALSAVRLATRFVLGPLLVVPAGALLMQIPLTPRTCLGLLGMASGALYLLFAREVDADPPTLLDIAP